LEGNKQFLSGSIGTLDVVMLLKEGSEDLMQQINTAIRELNSTDEINSILNTY